MSDNNWIPGRAPEKVLSVSAKSEISRWAGEIANYSRRVSHALKEKLQQIERNVPEARRQILTSLAFYHRTWLLHPPVGIGLTVALILLLMGLSSQRDTKCEDCSVQQYSGGRPGRVTDLSVSPISGLQSPTPDPRAERKEWREEQDLEAQWDQARWAFFAAIAALMSLFITTLAVIFVKQTLDAMREMAKEVRAATDAASHSAKAAHHAIQVGSESVEMQLRAYVCRNLAEIRNLDIGKVFQAHVVMKNAGQTPAYDLIGWIGVRLGEFPPKAPAPDPDPFLKNNASKNVLGPGNEHHLTVFANHPLTASEAALMQQAQAAVHVVGGVRYRDAFQKTRTTTFSLFYGGSYGMNKNLALSVGPAGNDAD
jgi:hypothetical protein